MIISDLGKFGGGVFAGLLFWANSMLGQGTAFSYQGRLNDANGPANGSYDFQFGLFATNAGGAVIAGPMTNSAVVVSNGLFLAAIDFGSIFNGTNYWLDVAVRTNGATLFTELNPRQPITPAPAALFAATAGTVSGTVRVGQLDTNALNALVAAQAAQTYATSSIPALAATNLTNIVSGITASSSFLNNLSGTLNSVISSNPPVMGNDILAFTNQNLSAASIGGIISSVASQSNAVVMIMGDSYTDGTGREDSGQGVGMSTAWVLGSLLRNAYGDDGAAGTCNGQGYGWGNETAHVLTSFSPAIWPLGYGLCWMTTNATNNVMFTGQNPIFGNGITPMPTNSVNLAGMCYITTPTGGSNNVTIWSINGGYTNTFGISTYGIATNFIRTNWPVPPASDYTMMITNLSGTNILFCPLFLSTNRGVQYIQFGFAGRSLDQYLTGWTNLWVQIFAAFNPDVFIFNNIHWPYSYDVNGNTSMAWSNQMASLSTMLPAKTKITLVGQPPNVGNNMVELNYQYRLLCQAQNWSYADLWSQFPSFTNSFSLGLFENDGVHPSTAGMIARAAILYKEMNFGNAFPVTVDARNVSGIASLTNNIAPTNSSSAITAKSFTGSFIGNGANLSNIPYSALTGAPILGTVAVLSSNAVVNMASNAVVSSPYFSTNPFSSTNLSALVSMVATQAIQQISTSAIPAAIVNIGMTNITVHALGGMNDDTAAFAAAFNSGVPVICPVGDYNVTNIVIYNDNESISGYGCHLHMAGNATGYVISTRNMTNVSIAGLSVYGGIHQTPGWTFTSGITGPGMADWKMTSAGGGNGTPANARSGFYLNGYGWNHWRDLTADGFNVVGFYMANTNQGNAYMTPLSSIDNCEADWCYVGMEIPGGSHTMDFTTNNAYLYYDGGNVIPYFGSPEYVFLNSPKAQNCSWGVSFGSPNFSMVNPQIGNCYIGVGALSRWHGQVNGGSINHCTWAWYGGSSFDGGTISGTSMLGGNGSFYLTGSGYFNVIGCVGGWAQIIVTNCTGPVNFVHCIDQNSAGPPAITTDNTGLNFIGTSFYGQTNAAQFVSTGTYTNSVFYGNGAGLTNLNAAYLTGPIPLGGSNLSALVSLVTTQAIQQISASAIPAAIINVGMTNITVQALGGTNDDTAVFAAAFNSGVPVICPVGDFNVTNIVIHNDNEVIYGYGCRLHMAGNATGYVISTRGMTNVSVAGLSVYGGFQQSPGWMMGASPIASGPTSWCDYNCVTFPLGLNTPANARSGFFCSMQGRGRFADLTANGFNVAGFYLANPLGFGAAGTPVGIFQNNFADWCYIGFELPQSLHSCDFTTNNVYQPYDSAGVIPGFGGADYTILNAPVAHNCTFGINDGAWNVPINNPQISACAIGICICDNTHNTITGGSINHESGGAGLAYYIPGAVQGPVVVGQEILDNPWNVYAVRAGSVTFSSCQFNPGQFLATNLTGAVVFMNCITNGGTVTTDNTGLSFVNCYGPGSTNASFFGGNSYRSATWSLPDLTNGMNTGDFKIVSSNGLALVSIWMTNGVPVLKQLAP